MKTRIATRLALLLAAATGLFGQNIDTITPWNGTSFISSFGVTDTATYGQTITLGAANTLNSVTFQIGFCSAAVNFRVSVYAWNGTSATGSALYTSSLLNVGTGSSYTAVTVNPSVSLPAGQYVIFGSTSQDQTGAPSSACRWGSIGNNAAYAGGNFVYINNNTNTAAWTSNTWNTIADDLAFRATFGNNVPVGTPTLSEWGMILMAGLLGIFSLRKISAANPTV